MMIPGGVFGERYGPRLALGSVTVTWGVLTALTGFAPSLMAATAAGAFVSLVAVRLLVGATNAPIFPITTGLIEGWFPPGRWALPHSVASSGLALGQAARGRSAARRTGRAGAAGACTSRGRSGLRAGPG